MRQPYQVLVYPARAVGGEWEYLLVRRVAGRGGFWQGVTGGQETGESLAEAAARELVEETGLIPRILAEIGYAYSFAMEDRWRGLYAPGVEEIEEHAFAAVMGENCSEPTLSDEHDRWQWCSLAQALNLLKWPENVEALQRCDAWLRSETETC